MLLKKVTVQNFRNIELASLEFRGRRQFLAGANGQGKTNFLEALGYVTALRSFRTAEHRLLIRREETEAALAFLFEHEVMGETPVQIRIRSSGRQVLVDQEKVAKLADFIGTFPTVVFSSDDIQFVRSSPGTRRRWMDLVFAATDSDYLQALQQYHRALQGRNQLLKKSGAEREIASFESAMAPLAATLFRKRTESTERFANLAREHYAAISAGREEARFRFKPDLAGESGDRFLEYWRKNRGRDVLLGATQRGPHRDDFPLELNGQLARDYGSEGQQRGLVLALRLAQVDFFRERLRLQPVLLADDIVNELDPVRRTGFWRAIGEEVQLIATGTSVPPGGGWQVFEVNAGKFDES